jgi:hypothetical protein
METICSSETSVDFQRTTWRYVPEHRTIVIHVRKPFMTLDISNRLLVMAALDKKYRNKICIFFEAVLSYPNLGL